MTNAILNQTELKKLRKSAWQIPHSLITVERSENPRTNYGDLEELAQQITEAGGVLMPILIGKKDGKETLLHGFRRYYALELLKEQGVDVDSLYPMPAFSCDANDRKAILYYHYILNNGTKALEPVEIGYLAQELIEEQGESVKDIAKKFGKAVSFVNDMLNLVNKAPTAVIEAIDSGKITENLVVEQMKVEPDPVKLEEKVDVAIENAQKAGRQQATKKDMPIDPDNDQELYKLLKMVNRYQAKLEEYLETKAVDTTNGKIKAVVEAYTQDDDSVDDNRPERGFAIFNNWLQESIEALNPKNNK